MWFLQSDVYKPTWIIFETVDLYPQVVKLKSVMYPAKIANKNAFGNMFTWLGYNFMFLVLPWKPV
jgi:hypothetical protein